MTGEPPFCLHCGCNTRPEAVLEDGPFRYDPRQGFFAAGARLPVHAAVHQLLGSIMAARGAIVSAGILAERLGYEGDHPAGLIRVLIASGRDAIEAAGCRFPVETLYRLGRRWNLAAVAYGEAARSRRDAECIRLRHERRAAAT